LHRFHKSRIERLLQGPGQGVEGFSIHPYQQGEARYEAQVVTRFVPLHPVAEVVVGHLPDVS